MHLIDSAKGENAHDAQSHLVIAAVAGMARQAVVQADPWKLLGGMDVIIRRKCFRLFQACRVEMDLVRKGVGVIRDR